MRFTLNYRIINKWHLLSVIVSCAIGCAVGFICGKRSCPLYGIRTLAEDEDGDGKPDSVTVLSNGLLHTLTLDRNRDGRFDFRSDFVNGKAGKSESDNNFDGVFDEWIDYYQELPAVIKTDADGDGRVDIFSFLTNGVMSYSIIRMTKGEKDFFTEYYKDGIRSKVVIMRNGIERVLNCGRYGQIELGDE